MRFPWVSRELYNRVNDELLKSEKERKELLDVILGRTAGLAELLPDPKSPAAEELIDPTTGILDARKLRMMAQDAANKRAGKI